MRIQLFRSLEVASDIEGAPSVCSLIQNRVPLVLIIGGVRLIDKILDRIVFSEMYTSRGHAPVIHFTHQIVL